MNVVNQKLAQDLEQSEVDALYSRLTAIQGIKGNPMGVEIKRFGHSTVFSVKNIPGPSFNKVLGLQTGDERWIDQIIDFYNKREIPPRFELTPTHVSSDLLAYLNKAGFYQSDFHTTLYADLSKERALVDSKASIRKLGKYEFDTFAKIYAQGFKCRRLWRAESLKIMKSYMTMNIGRFIWQASKINPPESVCYS